MESGKKRTGSGTTHLNNVFVYEEEVIFVDHSKTPFNSILQLFLHGVIAGILRNVVTDASALVHNRKRTFTFASADKPVDDPQLQQIIGQISSIAFAVEATVWLQQMHWMMLLNQPLTGILTIL